MNAVSAASAGGRRQRGAYAVAFVLLIVVLLGFAGLAIDSGRLYVSKSELQNAADSCALSAAAALTGANANQLQQAEDFGIAAGQRNLVGMQETPVTIPRDSAITFSATLGGTYLPKPSVANPLEMKYVRCTLAESNISTFLIQVVNLLPGTPIGPQDVAATAVASNEPSRSNCAMPLAVCRETVDAGDDAYGHYIGEWISGRREAGSGWDNPTGSWRGAFQWIEYPGYERNKDLEALMYGSGQCDLSSTNTINSHPGVITSLVDAWNSRFGVYKKSAPHIGIPDNSGYSYYPSGFTGDEPYGTALPAGTENQLNDFKTNRRPSFQPWNPDTPGWVNEGTDNYVPSTTTEHQAGGDRRLVVGPVVDCPSLGGGATNVPILDWACFFMLHPMRDPNKTTYIEYRGLASDPASGCVTSGLPGGSTGGPNVPTLVQ